MLGHHDVTDQTKSRCIAHSSQFFHQEVSRPRRFQKRQSPITTESDKVQIAFAIIAFKTRRHRQPQQKKQPPQDPGSYPEPGAPSVSLYFPETCRSDILSATQMSTNFKFSIRATRLGAASKALNLGLDASLKAAIDAGLAGAEVIGCLVPQ